MNAFPTLTTERLTLNQFQKEDIPSLTLYANNPKVAEMTSNIPHPYTQQHGEMWIENTQKGFENGALYAFAVRLQGTQEFIGGMGLSIDIQNNHAELGYWLAEPFWGKGYATEAAKEILRFGLKKLHLHRIYATHLAHNTASGTILQKIGMLQEGILKEHAKKGKKYYDLVHYGIVNNL